MYILLVKMGVFGWSLVGGGV